MKKEDVISAGIMTIVSMLVLIGFTVAWFTVGGVGVGGMYLEASEMNNIIIALEEGGKDISALGENSKYVEMGLQDILNVEQNKLAPGQYGQITFYVRPTDIGIEYCDIHPRLWISCNQGGGDYEWYPGADEGASLARAEVMELEELYEMVGKHIQFFQDEDMTKLIEDSFRVEWSEEDGKSEKPITIYWKWHYEYPFYQYYTEEALEELTVDAKQELIDTYDLEDTKIGNQITAMKFHFTFSAQ